MRPVYEGAWYESMRMTAAEAGTTNCFYFAGFPASINSTTVPTLNQLYAAPFYAAAGGVVMTLGINVATGAATAVARLGIYDTFQVGAPLPSILLLDGGGDLDCSTTGIKSHTGLSFVMQPGAVYWICAFFGTAAPTVTGLTGDLSCGGVSSAISVQHYKTKSGVTYGAFPTAWPTTGSIMTSTAPAMFVEFSSINRR